MNNSNILIDAKSAGLSVIQKMDFEYIDMVFDVLHDAFHPDYSPEVPDARFLALWTLFLASVGWTDDEYWEEWRSRPRTCHDCGGPLNQNDDHIDDLPAIKSEENDPSSKLN